MVAERLVHVMGEKDAESFFGAIVMLARRADGDAHDRRGFAQAQTVLKAKAQNLGLAGRQVSERGQELVRVGQGNLLRLWLRRFPGEELQPVPQDFGGPMPAIFSASLLEDGETDDA